MPASRPRKETAECASDSSTLVNKLLSRRTIYDLRPIHPANGLPYCNARERKSFRYCLPGSSNLLADLGHLDLRPCPHPVQRLHVGERPGEDIARACKPRLIALADPRAAAA